MPSSPDKTPSASPRFAAAASSSIPFEQGSVPSVVSEDDEDVDQLAFTLDAPSRPQLNLFEKVFNTGKSLASYSQDDPLWSLLSSIVASCTNCPKAPDTCVERYSVSGTSLADVIRILHIVADSLSSMALLPRGLPGPSRWTSGVELNMLDEGDALDRDHQELSRFIDSQRQEAAAASSPSRPGEATSSGSRSKTFRKRHCHLSPPSASLLVAPRLVRLVVPPGHPSHPKPVANTNPSMLPTSLDPVVGPTDLVRLAAIAEQRAGADRSPLNSIKGIGQNLLSSSMPTSCSPLVPHSSTIHPYRIENERLSMRVRALETQLAESQQKNSSLTSTLRDTSHLLEAHQREVEQLRTSQQEVIWRGLEYSRVLDQFQTLERALPGRPEQTLLERLREIQEELITAREERERRSIVYVLPPLSIIQSFGLPSSNSRVWLMRAIPWLLVNDNILRPCRKRSIGSVTVHPSLNGWFESSPRKASMKTFVELPPLLTVSIVRAQAVRYSIITGTWELVLEYLQAARGIHGELHVRTLSSLHWFFYNAADRDDGLYQLVLGSSRFSDDPPFLIIAQHAGYVPPFESALEPPLHCRMFTLDTALPYHGAGRNWEELMVSYVHHLSDTPLPEPSAHADIAVGDDTNSLLPRPLCLPLPLLSPPPLFGSLAPFTIDLTGDDDDALYESPEEASRRLHWGSAEAGPSGFDAKEESS
ncbi:hypothetical protein EV368DRAFT_87464 [Lentinula lateritia]|nr:hypothetical protein EV368DRAFT_87464 [Lentinula lateritia]